MKVTDCNSWSSEKYDSNVTNYINVTMIRSENDQELVTEYLIGIAEQLGWVLFEEDDDGGQIIFPEN